jgi:hypothetical protein
MVIKVNLRGAPQLRVGKTGMFETDMEVTEGGHAVPGDPV